MKNKKLCDSLENLSKFRASPKNLNDSEILNDLLDSEISIIVNTLINEPSTELEELDRILKWELLGRESENFDWGSVSWDEINRQASNLFNYAVYINVKVTHNKLIQRDFQKAHDFCIRKKSRPF